MSVRIFKDFNRMEPRQGPVRKNLIAITPISRQVKNKNKKNNHLNSDYREQTNFGFL